MERRCWLQTSGGLLYPNLFLLLIARPGIGKDQAIMPLRDVWAASGTVNLSPLSMTPQGLIDELGGITEDAAGSHAHRHIIDKTANTYLDYHTLTIAVPEFGVMCPAHDLQFLSVLNDLYNCGKVFDERLRSRKKRLEISNPHISIISGTQPAFLGDIFPEAAYGMGFTSRIIMVYADTTPKVNLFGSNWNTNNKLRADLIEDLKIIGRMYGAFQIDSDAAAAMEHFHRVEADKTAPTHGRLQNYNTRRSLHILKLMMVFSAARDSSRVIALEDFLSAKGILLEAEARMPEIFRAMQGRDQGAIIEETYYYILQEHLKDKKPVLGKLLYGFLAARVPTYQVDSIIEIMVSAEMLKEVTTHPNGLDLPGYPKGYIPVEFRRID